MGVNPRGTVGCTFSADPFDELGGVLDGEMLFFNDKLQRS